MSDTVENAFYKATLDNKGSWGIKPKLPSVVRTKASGKETPRYPVIVEYEVEMKRGFDDVAKKISNSLGDLLGKYLV